MGNIGRSSTGCFLCRKRKIKCDEGKPGCRKCALKRIDCPGYPFSVELKLRPEHDVKVTEVWTHDNFPTSDLGHRPFSAQIARHLQTVHCEPKLVTKGSSPDEDTFTKQEVDVAQTNIELIPLHRSPTLTPPPKYDVQHQSTCFFLNLFCFQANRIYGAGVIDYLPGMLARAEPDTCLYQATMAVSRLTLADRYSGHDMRLQTAQAYGQALAKTNATIRDTSKAVKDETVVAVWLLGLYENVGSVLSHCRNSISAKSPAEEYQSHISHIRGALNLLRMRGKSQLTSPVSNKIYRVFKAAIQMRLFMLNGVTSTDFENLELDIRRDEHEFLPSVTARKATDYFHTVMHLLEGIKYSLRRYSPSSSLSAEATELQTLFRSCESLDASMSNWASSDPGWDMMKVTESAAGTVWSFYPSHALYFFYNFWVYLYWLRYLIARVKLYEALILATQQQRMVLGRNPSIPGGSIQAELDRMEFKISQYQTLFQLAAGDIIGLTAYALGDVTNTGEFEPSSLIQGPEKGREINVLATMQLVIPLKLLQRSDYSTLAQKRAVEFALTHIGDGFRRQPASP